MRRNGEAFSAAEVVGVGAAIAVVRGFLEILGELLRRLRFKGASLCFFDFLSRCLGGDVESIVRFSCGGESEAFFLFPDHHYSMWGPGNIMHRGILENR